MATSYSPKIVTDGLYVCLDAADKKSLLAPPTTNLANNSNGTINWTTNNLVGTRTQSTVNANDYHYRFVLDKGSNSYIAFRFAFDHTNLTNGETYIMSYKYKVTSGSGTFQVTDFCDVGVTRVTKDIGDGWYYETAYASRSSYDETYDFFDVQASDNMTVDIKEIQVEHTSASSPLATPFVSYQRQWKDRAGSNDGTPENMSDQSNFSSEGGGSLIFDGSNDYIDLGDADDLGYNTSTLTLEAWVKEESSSSDAYATILGTRYGNNISLCRWNTTDYLGVLKNDSQGNVNFQTTAVAFDEEWHHIACTYNEGQVKQYVDGVLVDTDGIYLSGRTINTSADNFGVGGDDRGRHFHGLIPQARIYNKQLTDAEILQNYNATKGRFGL